MLSNCLKKNTKSCTTATHFPIHSFQLFSFAPHGYDSHTNQLHYMFAPSGNYAWVSYSFALKLDTDSKLTSKTISEWLKKKKKKTSLIKYQK